MLSSALMVGRGIESPLALFVRRMRIEKRLSLNDVVRESGNKITNAYVSRIENGHVQSPSPPMLVALAKGLGVSEDELFVLVRGIREPKGLRASRIWEMFEAYERIENPDHKRAIDGWVDALIRSIDALPKKKKKADGPIRVEPIRKNTR